MAESINNNQSRQIVNGQETVANTRAIPTKQLKFVSSLNTKVDLPNASIKCLWSTKCDPANSPHTKVDWRRKGKVFPDILHVIGNTPVVKLNKIPQSCGLKCDVYVKCDFFNPGGSIKDRIGYRMVEDAEHNGILKPGYTIIEPTSGNTGIGLALAAAVKGYRCIIVMSEKMSNEKIDVLHALGAEIIRTPITADSISTEGLFAVCHRLKNEIPNSVILDQYSNPGNPLAHYDTTAEEILHDMDSKVDMIVMGTGTGGTMTGIARRFKEISPNTMIVGADPVGSIIADFENQSVGFYEIEGIGYDFIPTSIDRRVVDRWVKVEDKESFIMARRLIREEGLLCGGSSGSALAGAIKAAKDLKKGQRLVVVLPDSIRNYLTKFVSDQWMEARGFKPAVNTTNAGWWDLNVTNVINSQIITAPPDMNCDCILQLMKKHGIDQVPVVDKNGAVLSVITMQKLLNLLISGRAQSNDPITKAFVGVFPKLPMSGTLGVVSRVLEREHYVLIIEKKVVDGNEIDVPIGIVTAIDLLHFTSTFNSQNNCCT